VGKHISGQLFSRVSVRGVAITAAAVLALGALATTSASVSRNASADTAPVGGLPATVSADALPTVQINGVAWAQVTVGNTVYVTGSFTQARPAGVAVGGTGSVTRSNLLAYDITTGNLITTFNHSLNAQGLAIAASPNGSTVYVVGDFTKVDNATHNHIAAFSTATGALISTFTGNLNGSTKAVTANNTTVYVGGGFTTANGVSHQHLAAFSSAGALQSWNPSTSATVSSFNPTASAIITAMVIAPDQSRVVVAGQFDHLDGDARTGLGAVNATTGADMPWDVTNPIADDGSASNLTSLTADATQVYGGGFFFTHGGDFEGRFAVNPDTGTIIWMNSCHGDTYATFPMGQVLYSASHEHECTDIGSFSQTTGAPEAAVHHFGAAETTYATGTEHPAIFQADLGPVYPNYGGQPISTQLDWYPTFTPGTYTGQSQAAWSVSGNSKYISYGGEFPTVNGTKQQGLVRFAISSIAPNKVGPTGTATLKPTVVSQSSGTARVAWQAAWDEDNSTLTYAVTRDSSTTPIYTTTVNSEFWNRPALSYTDKNLTPGSTHSYKVRVTDPFGNTVLSAATSVTIGSATTDAYTASVLASAPLAFWPLSEPAGSALGYDHAGGADLTMGAHGTFGVAGPHAGSSAVSFQGDPTTPSQFVNGALTDPINSTSTSGTIGNAAPLATYSIEAWAKTTSATGGMIAGDGLWQTGDSWVEDRVLYFDKNGDLRFGAFNNGPTNNGLDSTIVSPTPYNDGSWHYIVGTLGAGGATLYVDGVQVAADPTMVDTSPYWGNWRVGGDALTGWKSAPSNGYLAGSVADVAVYPNALPAATVLSHYNGGAIGASSPIAKFTSTCSAESCTFDGSTSSDTGGTIATYSWNFGDGSPVVTGASSSASHVYTGAGSFPVNLTITDNTHSTDGVNHNIAANFGTGVPVAAFTSHCTGLSCVFDGSTSTDTGGTITTYSWNFGDATPAVTGASATTTHVYATSTFYQPTLTVTDSTSSIATHSSFVFPVPAGPLQASFTFTCAGLNCSFNAGSSTDTSGTIKTYSWQWGDGSPVYSTVSPTTTHGYVSAGSGYLVTLTVTDSTNATNSVSQLVAPTGAPPPSTPVAAFTSNCTGLSCAFTDASTDTGGTITGRSWNFGDGTPASTSQSPTHVYATGGTYTVTLTVTDNLSDTNAVSHSAAPVGGASSTPVASFTSVCTSLSCAFTNTSTDTGGTITGYSWDFGDGAVSTSASPTHVYASANTYNVKLTVTDNLAATNTANANVAPTSGVVTLYASDTFNRTVAGGLGTANLGGAWTRVGGAAANLSVAPGAASFLMPTPSTQDSAYLASVSNTSTETDTTFTTNNVATGTGGIYVYVEGRRVGTNNEYDARVRVTSTGTVGVELVKYAASATVTAIGSEVILPGVTFAPGTQLNVRLQVSGTGTTTLKVKVWPSTSAEPSAWTLTKTDTTAGLQAAGAVGLTTYLSGSTTNAPTTVKFSSFSAGPLQP
jgi:PKD repeat protein